MIWAKIMPNVSLFPGRGKECYFWGDSKCKADERAMAAKTPDGQICSNLAVFVIEVKEFVELSRIIIQPRTQLTDALIESCPDSRLGQFALALDPLWAWIC